MATRVRSWASPHFVASVVQTREPVTVGGALLGTGGVLVGPQRDPVVAFDTGDGRQVGPGTAVEQPLDGRLRDFQFVGGSAGVAVVAGRLTRQCRSPIVHPRRDGSPSAAFSWPPDEYRQSP